MWIGILAGWIVGSAALYTYLVRTAKEPKQEECMECHRTDCADCPYMSEQTETQLKRAA